MSNNPRPGWGSRIGIIMAVSGSAVGLGNFLRFPVQAAQNGGGAFMIPYFISLLLLGIPLMWVEWAVGRYGGAFGHGSAPGMFYKLWNNRFIKYFGIIGIMGPLVIFVYYTYISSWLVGYAFYSLTGLLSDVGKNGDMSGFLSGYQGVVKNQYFNNIWPAYAFFIFTFALNILIVYRGIAKGIELLCKIAMPILFVFAAIVVIRVLTFGPPNLSIPELNPIAGLGFLWNPDFSVLYDSRVWLAAAGQIFFTLSVGFGVILTYASYLKKGDDVVLSGLTSTFTNELAEVVIGGSIAIPAAFAFFGPQKIVEIAHSGAFNLGFVTMPLIFARIPLGFIYSFLWFVLLFLAALTSSVSLLQPVISFMEDEFNISKKKAVFIVMIISFIASQGAIFFIGHGVIDELDFWGGTLGLVVFALIETILFAWVFGINRAWEEIHHGAELRVPNFYKFILKYITPLFLIVILGFWLYQHGLSVILMKNVSAQDFPYILGTRICLIISFVVLAIFVKIAFRRKYPK